MARKSSKLRDISENLKDGSINLKDIKPKSIRKLKKQLVLITDKRMEGKIVHYLSDIVLIVFFSMIANIDTWVDMERFTNRKIRFFKKFLDLPNGIPSHDTIQRVIGIINKDELETLLVSFLKIKIDKIYKSLNIKDKNLPKIISIDGKTLNGSGRKSSKDGVKSSLQVLNVFDHQYGICIRTVPIDSKTNEIPVTQEVLKLLNIKDSIITFDALNTQKDTIKEVNRLKGDYVVALKNNHKNSYEDLSTYFDIERLKEIEKARVNYIETIEKKHSQIETRKYYSTTDVSWFKEANEWEGLKAIALVKKTINKNDVITEENRYYISSITDTETISICIREHWAIEINLHWHLDYTFLEDYNTTADKNSLINLNILRKFTLGLITLLKPFYPKASLRAIRNIIQWTYEEELENVFKLLSIEDFENCITKNKKVESPKQV